MLFLPNNNPNGYNAFGGPLEHETPYGAVEKLKTLTKAVPNMPTASPSPQEAPRRAQRRATKGQQAPLVPPVAPSPQVSYEQTVNDFWQQLASTPGASEQIRKIASGP